MEDKPLKPGYEKIVVDFDKWLSNNYGQLLEKDTITVIKEIHNHWTDLKNGYIEFMLKRFNDLLYDREKIRH